MKSRTIRRILYVCYLVVATTILLEIAVRIWGYSERYIYDPIYMPFQSGTDIPFVHKPLLVSARARSSTWFSTDSLGLRSAEPNKPIGKKKTNEFRIACVGNSTTFGQGVSTGETYCFLIETLLNQRQSMTNVRMFNFGISGYSVKEMAATMEHRVFQVEPDLVLACVSFDDFDTTRCGGVDRWGYNISYKRSGDIDKNSVFKLLLRPLHLAYLIRDLRYYYFEHGDDSWTRSADVLSTTLPSSYRYVRMMKAMAGQQARRLVLVTLPTSDWSGVQFKAILAQCKRDSVELLDLSPLGKEIPPSLYNVGRFDGHPSALVHERIAERLVDYLLWRLPRSSSIIQ